MLPISRILVPVDFSERSLGIIPYVKVIAAKYEAEVTLLHVVNPFYAIPATGLSGPAMIPVPQSVFEDTGRQLDTFAAAELDGLKVRRLVYQGDPASQIVEFAQAEGINLIAMPTHGYGVLRRFLIGSVTSKVLHDLPCPVLTGVHTDEKPAGHFGRDARLSNIFCAVDMKLQNRHTLAWASQLSNDFHAKLGIVHAQTPLNPNLALLLQPDFKIKLEEISREALTKLQVAAGAESASLYTDEGEPAETVCSFAKSAGADLLVIGRGHEHGKGGRLSTNAYSIIRQSPCPVISV